MERLFECLKNVIINGNLIHGSELHGEVTDEILTFTVNYDGFVLENADENIVMEDLEITAESKG
jgi:hypothetical protein